MFHGVFDNGSPSCYDCLHFRSLLTSLPRKLLWPCRWAKDRRGRLDEGIVLLRSQDHRHELHERIAVLMALLHELGSKNVLPLDSLL